MTSWISSCRRPAGRAARAAAAVTFLVLTLLVSVTVGFAPADAAAKRVTNVSGWRTTDVVANQGSVVKLGLRVSPSAKARRTVVLQRRADGARHWVRVTSARAGKRGGVSLRVPTASAFQGSLRVVVKATRRHRALVTPARDLLVRPRRAGGLSSVELEVVRLVNQARASARSCGGQHYAAVRPLRADGRLSDASRRHARDMGVRGYFSHDSADGRSPWDRAEAAGYYTAGAENIAAGQPTPAAVVQSWLDSAGHCRNIMARDMVDIGVGFAEVPGSPYTEYWVQMFGRG